MSGWAGASGGAAIGGGSGGARSTHNTYLLVAASAAAAAVVTVSVIAWAYQRREALRSPSSSDADSIEELEVPSEALPEDLPSEQRGPPQYPVEMAAPAASVAAGGGALGLGYPAGDGAGSFGGSLRSSSGAHGRTWRWVAAAPSQYSSANLSDANTATTRSLAGSRGQTPSSRGSRGRTSGEQPRVALSMDSGAWNAHGGAGMAG
eukprot:CAMPEP_0206142608 /NCGR_PEP_ID=MMETSP1473-20131121/17578_1 /ASSEMBLY_ACC=CAM_ASM_001109 /TAXON_ID=1461547 /ORGANISM="Stichococcus sp, Strain RCC1054" /LENGTH=205 /DNA_ID=CAMNT_0053537661 /DNA_START=373 /DNA_END=986 /DNA_ORIENTATION=+